MTTKKQLASSQITSTSLPVGYRNFLHAANFNTDESIGELEKAAGTILTGMVMLVNLLKKNTMLPSSKNQRETFGVTEVKERAVKAPRRQIHPTRQFDRDRFNETKALCERMSGQS